MAHHDSQNPKEKAIEPLLLQAYFDGELDEAESFEVETLFEHSASDAKRLSALKEMRELVRFDVEQGIEQVEFGALWSRLESTLEFVETPVQPAREVERRTGGLWQQLADLFAGHRGAFALAAVVAIVAVIVLPRLANTPPPDRVIEKERTIVIVEPLRFEGNSTGAVSYTPQSNTPVIWYLGGGAVESGLDYSKLPENIREPAQRILSRLEHAASWGQSVGTAPSGLDQRTLSPEELRQSLQRILKRLEQIESSPTNPDTTQPNNGPI